MKIEELDKEIIELTATLKSLKNKRTARYKQSIKNEIRDITKDLCEKIDLDSESTFFSRYTASNRVLRGTRDISDKKFCIFYTLCVKYKFRSSYVAETLNHDHSNISYHMKNSETTKKFPEVARILEKIY